MVPGGSVLASCPKTGTATDDAAAAAAARRKLRRSICVSSCACFFGAQRVISRQSPSKPGRRRLAAEAKTGPDFATDFRNGKAKSVQWARPAGNDIIFVEGHYHSRLGLYSASDGVDPSPSAGLRRAVSRTGPFEERRK